MSLSKYLLAIKTPGQPLLLTPRPFQSNPSCIHTPFPSLPNRTTSKFLHPIIITSITALVSSFRLFWAVTYLLTCFNLNSILRNYAIYLDHCGITQAILLHQGIIADCFGNVLHIYCLLPSSYSLSMRWKIQALSYEVIFPSFLRWSGAEKRVGFLLLCSSVVEYLLVFEHVHLSHGLLF